MEIRAMKYNVRSQGYCGVESFATLKAARAEIIARIKEDKRLYGKGNANKLWQDIPVTKMQADNWVRIHIGKKGYHIYSAYGITLAHKE